MSCVGCAQEKAVKRLPANRNIHIDSDILEKLTEYFGKERVKVIEKHIENR